MGRLTMPRPSSRSVRAAARYIGFALLLGGVFFAGSIYQARSAPSSSTIHACVNRYNGDMRMPRSPKLCASTEYSISWESYDAGNLDSAYVNENQANSITSDMIVDGEVQNSDLSADSVTGDKVLDGTLSAADLGTDSVGSDEIQANAVTGKELAANSVTSGHIFDGQIVQGDLNASLVDFIDGQSVGNGYQVSVWTYVLAPGTAGNATAFCPSNKVVLGGGGEANPDRNVFLADSFPRSDTPAWDVTYHNDSGAQTTIRVYAICANP